MLCTITHYRRLYRLTLSRFPKGARRFARSARLKYAKPGARFIYAYVCVYIYIYTLIMVIILL